MYKANETTRAQINPELHSHISGLLAKGSTDFNHIESVVEEYGFSRGQVIEAIEQMLYSREAWIGWPVGLFLDEPEGVTVGPLALQLGVTTVEDFCRGHQRPDRDVMVPDGRREIGWTLFEYPHASEMGQLKPILEPYEQWDLRNPHRPAECNLPFSDVRPPETIEMIGWFDPCGLLDNSALRVRVND